MFKPYADRALIRLIEEEEEKSLIIKVKPDEPKPGPLRGEVVAHGPGTQGSKLECKVGDKVLFTHGTRFNDDAWPEFKGLMIVMFNSIIGEV
jgi:co-chaperonin GroES (HSP10)